MNILVTGGAGYVGSQTVHATAVAGHTPIIYDNLSTGTLCAVGQHRLIRADLADAAATRRAINENCIHAIFHFAAHCYVRESVDHPRAYFQNNVVNTLQLLDVMLECGVKFIIYSSSCATYGMPETAFISERHPQRPQSPYGESKLFIERVLGWYGRAYGLRWVALRYFNAAGATENTGECHVPETHLIPLAIEAALTGVPLRIFGANHETEDGSAVRDYVHIADLASAHLSALEYLVRNEESQAFNLGTGQGYSVLNVLKTVEKIANRPVPYQIVERNSAEPARLVADSSAAMRALKWKPQHSSLEEIVKSAWWWHSKMRRKAGAE
jgi:UDP-arabinose 4-epimerase